MSSKGWKFVEVEDGHEPTVEIGGSVKDLAPSRKEGHGAIDPGNDSVRKNTAICPRCDCTCIKQRRAVDSFHCSRCDRSWKKEEIIDLKEE